MSLNRALIDQARRVYSREDPDRPWQEGEPESAEAYGPWVPVRMRRQDESEQDNGVRVDEQGALLIGLRDSLQAPTFVGARFTAWDADDMVEVAYEGATERWFVASGVRPLRRRRGFVGFRCSLRKSREAEVTEGALTLDPALIPEIHVADEPPPPTGAPPDPPTAPTMPEVVEPPPVAVPVDPEWATEVG